MASTSPAFSPLSQDDRRGLLWIAAILSLIFVVLTFSARLYVRRHMLGRDDYAGIAAVILSTAQYITLFTGMTLGLGTSKKLVRGACQSKLGQVCCTITESLQSQMLTDYLLHRFFSFQKACLSAPSIQQRLLYS